MTILDMVDRRLSLAGYDVTLTSSHVRFEDASVLGFVAEFVSVAALLDDWKHAEENFLREHAAELRRDRRKAWNVYSILLTHERASAEQTKRLIAVEENFRATRKIARDGVTIERDIDNALGVLLPIRHRVSLSSENALDLLRNRLSALPPAAVHSMLLGGNGEDIADALVREEETE